MATAIRELREARGWSQTRLAEAVCQAADRDTVTRETISRWESGKRKPGSFWRPHLATALRVPLDALEAARVDRRRFLMAATGVSVAPMIASDLLAAGFAAADVRRTTDDWDAVVDDYGRTYMRQGVAGR
ncbi:helix-turn-helix transcriptional regulator, partial [Nocardiopsis lucentensis]|uniref:helix-turn-helix transcriptional regulator n=1 Tax=Nocardiopsis lucentensis TaxID=53441 RepID=UPI001376F4A7